MANSKTSTNNIPVATDDRDIPPLSHEVAKQRIEAAAFEVAFAEYQRQRAVLEGIPREQQDWSKGNPLDPLDNAHAAMMEIPAPNFDALLRKMEAVTGEFAQNLGWEAQYFIDDLIADLRRLLGKEAV